MSEYEKYDDDQLEELFSNFLIDSWSYSKVANFARNEKSFERRYIYRVKDSSGASTIAGQAYHHALESFFNNIQGGEVMNLVQLQQSAYAYIDDVPARVWKLQKTTPTIQKCKEKAVKLVTSLLENFVSEQDLYLEEVKEVLFVEERFDEWLTINGVDIPMPCHAIADLGVLLYDGRRVIIDHKSKTAYTTEQEKALVIGKQAITYVKSAESKFGYKIDEVWFIENKSSKNKDGSPQMHKLAIELDDDTRRLYESFLYEPLKRMVEAVSNPDYVFLMNDSDNFVDKAELYDFHCRTLLAEVSDFDIPENKQDLVQKRMRKIRDASLATISPKVITKFKDNAAAFIPYDIANSNMEKKEKIEHVLRSFGIIAQVAHEIKGYSSDTFLVEASAGVKIANIAKYKLDIASALNVNTVRIAENLTVYNGKSYLPIEASKKREEDLLFDESALVDMRLPIGMNNYGEVVVWDLRNHSTPHMLVCGATGSGKSVSITSTIAYAKLAGVNDVIIFDPKYEFCHLGVEYKVYNEIEQIEEQMSILVGEMQDRAKMRSSSHPIKLVVFDEFADAVASGRKEKELGIGEKTLEEKVKMILQKGRSLGFRFIIATQRASTKVITGDAKVNLPVQVCFRVPKEVDSKVVIDEGGAEGLSGRGDGLIRSPEYSDIVRFQGYYKD